MNGTVFEQCFAAVIGTEGGLTTDPADPGNWTGGRCHVGTLRGTKYGISAAAYPETDIAALTLAQAQAIYLADYWPPAGSLPPQLALLLFDSAVNNGRGQAAQWLQEAVGAEVDGDLGPVSLAAIAHTVAQPQGLTGLCAEFLALRLTTMAALPTWPEFALGWARRLCRLPYAAAALDPSQPTKDTP